MTSEYAFLPLGHAHHLWKKELSGMATENFQQRASKPRISLKEFQQIVKGDIITYLLAPEMLPTNPLKEWHGRIEEHNKAGWVKVTLLDDGYVGETEIVRKTEILSVAKNSASQERNE